MKFITVVGARPNFVKIAPLVKYLPDNIIVHTGQHYDYNMSKVFFEGMDIPEPTYNLNVGSGTHTEQTSTIMSLFEPICVKEKPDIVIVVGDVNSTLACSLVVSKMDNVKLAHIESGERSFDRSMPEEINRVITDHISDYLFCSTKDAMYNLLHEGISNDKIYHVGNIVIDNIVKYKDIIDNTIKPSPQHTLFTLHRPFNTDNREQLKNILQCINELENANILFPIHPRTRAKIDKYGLQEHTSNMKVIEPLNYLEFITSLKNAKCMITDSGGIQVESAYFGVPCITLRDNTEHIFTLKSGVNVLVGSDIEKIQSEFYKSIKIKKRIYDSLWDGKVSERIKEILINV